MVLQWEWLWSGIERVSPEYALEQEIADSKAETYVSREKAMEILGKGSTTLWRWKKMGYLVPITVGAIDRYRMSDIRRIMEGG